MTQINGNAYLQVQQVPTQSLGKADTLTVIDANDSFDAAKGFTEKVEVDSGMGLGGLMGGSVYVTPTAKAHLAQMAKAGQLKLVGGTDASSLLQFFGSSGPSHPNSQSKL